MESRARHQPPAADLPHAQLGINALATAAVLRVENRLPFRQVTRLLADTLGLSVCAAAVARQVQRLGRWLGGEYEHLKTRLRSGQVAYADETGTATTAPTGGSGPSATSGTRSTTWTRAAAAK